MTDTVEFTVTGSPVPQGSSRAFVIGSRAVIVSKSRPLAAWRTDIATVARLAMGDRPAWPGPVAVTLHFRPSPRPASHYLPANRSRPVPVLRADAPEWNAGAPDADKLARAALDALTGVVFRDDRQVVRLSVTTRWPDEAEGTGVDVIVSTKGETR